MSLDKDAFSRLKTTLDQNLTWPSSYVFKFIVPQAKLAALLVIFDGTNARTSLRDSQKGNYVGLTAEFTVPSSDAVVDIYRRAAAIPGILAL